MGSWRSVSCGFLARQNIATLVRGKGKDWWSPVREKKSRGRPGGGRPDPRTPEESPATQPLRKHPPAREQQTDLDARQSGEKRARGDISTLLREVREQGVEDRPRGGRLQNPKSYKASKLKPQLKMAVTRLQIAANKKSALMKQQIRDIARLLAEDPPKEEKARIKAEGLIRDDYMVEAYEILQLNCELLSERIQLITH
ncbi:hypothetical protein THAOC_03183, partial [Thalassiosira oceanica]